MIKKRYMILSVVLVSVLLGSLFYVSITSAGKPIPEPNQVEVTNFPLDEEGNLKVTQMNGEQNVTRTIIVVQNYTITSVGSTWTFIDSVDVTGYRYVSIFVAYYQDHTDDWLYYEPNCLDIGVISYALELGEPNGHYQTGITGFEVGAPNIVFRVYSGGGSIELTIVLYCYN